MSAFVLMSDEANEEAKKFLDSPMSMVGVDSDVLFKLSDSRVCSMALFMVSHHSLD